MATITKPEVPTEEEAEAITEEATMKVINSTKATRLSKSEMASLKVLNQSQLKMSQSLKLQHSRNRGPLHLCPVSKWFSRGLAGGMHNRSFSKSLLRKRSLLLPKLKNLSKLKRPKAFLRCSLSLRPKKAPKKLKRPNHSNLRRNIKR